MAGQTLAEIRSLLQRHGLAPRHRLGQNFLIDLNLMRKLVAAAEVGPADVVLEVGPGTGSLSEILLETGARLIAVELDRGLHGLLAERLSSNPRLMLLQGDALDSKHALNPAMLEAWRTQTPGAGGARKLVANLPYQIATPLLMELLVQDSPQVGRMCVTIQREVGQRLRAEPRSEAYGPASIVTQSLARVETIATLPPEVFWPRPKVSSLMLDIRPLPADARSVDEPAAFAAFVRAAFLHRRKTLRYAARSWENPAAERILEALGISPNWRPEQVAPVQWRACFRRLRSRPSN